MPASYHISTLFPCIIVRLEGSVSNRDLMEAQRQIFSDSRFQGHYSRLIDATEVSESVASAETVRDLATAAVERGLRKAALISNGTELVYTLMQMYEAYARHEAE